MFKESQKSGHWSRKLETRSTARRVHDSPEDPKEGSGGYTGEVWGAWGKAGEDLLSTSSSPVKVACLEAKAMAKG